jgi:hypothetical protein
MKYYHYNMKKGIIYHLWVRISIYGNTITITNLDALDFQLDALLEQKILTYLISQANMQLVTAQKAAKEGFDNTQ